MLGKGDEKKMWAEEKEKCAGRAIYQTGEAVGKSYLSGVSDTSIAVADSRLPVTISFIVL